jgi:hypothetical protein
MNEKWIEILQAADYPQGSVTANDLMLMAKYYDPSYIQAPVIAKHRQFNGNGELINNEAALGWIKAIKVKDGSLYALFENNDDLKNIYDGKTYRYGSAEIQTENINGEKVPYLGALAVTNFPASKIAPIKLNGKESIRIYSSLLKIEKDNKMNPDQMKLICKKLGIKEDSTPEQIIAHITKLSDTFKDNENFTKASLELVEVLKLVKTEKTDAEVPELKKFEDSLTKLTATVEGLVLKLAATSIDKAEDVFNQALADKKVLPSQKELLIGTKEKPGTFYGNAEGLKKFVDTMPVLKLSSTVNIPNYKGGSQPVTYAQVLKDAKLYNEMKQSNPEALEALRQEWLKAPESQVVKEEGGK